MVNPPTITITGSPASGKTALAAMIGKLLSSSGFSVEIIDDSAPVDRDTATARIGALKDKYAGKPIAIATRQVNREVL
jgi:adenylylsulfate kinase-like enzyme